MILKTLRHKDLFYSAVRLNTEISYKNINELIEKKVIYSYRGIADLDLLKRISKGEFDLSQKTVSRVRKLIESYPKIMKIVESYMKIAEVENIQVISCEDNYYPYNWRVQSGMPKVFYARGNYGIMDRLMLKGSAAVVGSRNPSKYALYATDKFCSELGHHGVTIVSGMACGIDRQAHLSSVDTPGGTIAVLAGGVDNVYPASNRDIYDIISNNGLVISEMPPGQKPLRQYFPSRNRLIAGLTDCTLIMEAGPVSGTLHTASFAANQGKELFVLPNNIYYENSLGGLKLLEDGANVLLSTDNVIDSISHALMYKRLSLGCLDEAYYNETVKADIDDQAGLDVLWELAREKPEALDDPQWKTLIKDALTLKPLCIDELCVLMMLPFYKISRLLTELELNGTVCQEKGKYSLTFV